MDDELERLINTLFDGEIRCYDCHTPLDIQANELERQSEHVYTTRYNCPSDSCSIEYDVRVEDEGLTLHFEANERGANRPDKPADMTRISRKEPSRRSHIPSGSSPTHPRNSPTPSSSSNTTTGGYKRHTRPSRTRDSIRTPTSTSACGQTFTTTPHPHIASKKLSGRTSSHTSHLTAR